MMSDKIKPHHLARKAMLYVRQSSAHQVQHNLESQRLQYAMQDRVRHLGWREIEVVDDDLGRSAAGLVTRAGFARMVAEVCLGQVGETGRIAAGNLAGTVNAGGIVAVTEQVGKEANGSEKFVWMYLYRSNLNNQITITPLAICSSDVVKN
jgi:hypothetical protein